MVIKAKEFGKSDEISQFSEETISKLNGMEATLSQLIKLNQEQFALKERLTVCISRLSGLNEKISIVLNAQPDKKSDQLRSLEEARDQLKAQLERGISDKEMEALVKESLQINGEAIKLYFVTEDLKRKAKATDLLFDLAAKVFLLRTYVIAYADLSITYPKKNLFNMLHVRMMKHSLQSAIKESKDLYDLSKFIWTLKMIVKILTLIPSKIEMLVSLLTLKSKLSKGEVGSAGDVKALICLDADLIQILKAETLNISMFRVVVDTLEKT